MAQDMLHIAAVLALWICLPTLTLLLAHYAIKLLDRPTIRRE